MRKLALALAVLAAAAFGAAFAWAGHAQPQAFRLADASAACRLQGARLVCANLQARSALALPTAGSPRAVDAHVWWDASTPVLETWRHGGLACSVAAGSILCRNARGASISVGPVQLAVAL